MAKLVRVEIKMLSLIVVVGSGLGHLLGEGCMGQKLDLQIFTHVFMALFQMLLLLKVILLSESKLC